MIAAEITGRTCHAIELMGEYVPVAVERWQAFTGIPPGLRPTAGRLRWSQPNGARHRKTGDKESAARGMAFAHSASLCAELRTRSLLQHALSMSCATF
jgi:hypothetical protein